MSDVELSEPYVLKDARDKRRRGDHAGALAVLERLANSHPSERLLESLVVSLVEMERFESALDRIDDANARYGESATRLIEAGRIYLLTKRPALADNRLKRALELEPKSIDAWFLEGFALEELDRTDQALAAYERVERLAGASPRVDVAIGKAHERLQRFEEARRRYRRAAEAWELTDVKQAWNARALEAAILVKLGKYRDANSMYSMLFSESWPERSDADEDLHRLRAAQSALEALDLDAAQRHGTWLKSQDNVFRLFAANLLASCAAARHDYLTAWTYMAEMDHIFTAAALGGGPSDEWLRGIDLRVACEMVGAARMTLGRYEDAANVFDLAYERARRPDGSYAADAVSTKLALVDLFLEQRNNATGDSYAQHHLRARDEARVCELSLRTQLDVARSAAVLLDLAAVMLRMDDAESAEQFLREAINADGQRSADESKQARLLLAVALVHNGKLLEAIGHLRAATNQEREDVSARVRLAQALQQHGALDAAELELRSARALAPRDLATCLALADVLLDKAGLSGGGAHEIYIEAHELLQYALTAARETQAWVSEGCPPVGGSRGRQIMSGWLSGRRLAEAEYLRGYACVQLYETASGATGVNIRSRTFLSNAKSAFKNAIEADPTSFLAKQASQSVEERLNSVGRLSESQRLGRTGIAFLSVVLLGLTQWQFFFRSGRERLPSAGYTIATFGLLAFLVIALYLPQLLKLRVAGIELEKSPNMPEVGVRLSITRPTRSAAAVEMPPVSFMSVSELNAPSTGSAGSVTFGQTMKQESRPSSVRDANAGRLRQDTSNDSPD